MPDIVVRQGFEIGECATFTKTISETDVATFAEVTGDSNPLHMDDDYARRTRFGRRIAHGMLTAGLISTVLGTKLPGPGAIYLEQTLKFLAPVYLGDTIAAEVEVIAWRADKGIITLRTTCRNQDGQEVLAGQAVLMVSR
ncbi:MAG: MaoC family dehydratase [Anaerolineae bacterium]|nr:MaoC family dehydratase [Anaerolineae bacterium]